MATRKPISPTVIVKGERSTDLSDKICTQGTLRSVYSHHCSKFLINCFWSFRDSPKSESALTALPVLASWHRLQHPVEPKQLSRRSVGSGATPPPTRMAIMATWLIDFIGYVALGLGVAMWVSRNKLWHLGLIEVQAPCALCTLRTRVPTSAHLIFDVHDIWFSESQRS